MSDIPYTKRGYRHDLASIKTIAQKLVTTCTSNDPIHDLPPIVVLQKLGIAMQDILAIADRGLHHPSLDETEEE